MSLFRLVVTSFKRKTVEEGEILTTSGVAKQKKSDIEAMKVFTRRKVLNKSSAGALMSLPSTKPSSPSVLTGIPSPIHQSQPVSTTSMGPGLAQEPQAISEMTIANKSTLAIPSTSTHLENSRGFEKHTKTHNAELELEEHMRTHNAELEEHLRTYNAEIQEQMRTYNIELEPIRAHNEALKKHIRTFGKELRRHTKTYKAELENHMGTHNRASKEQMKTHNADISEQMRTQNVESKEHIRTYNAESREHMTSCNAEKTGEAGEILTTSGVAKQKKSDIEAMKESFYKEKSRDREKRAKIQVSLTE
ncbi:unnamed protein product [Mytilus coruscus]|uniref:Uncharacterized protein n=1 Tax=Mytilus coruscus TaxID=42192 RepID=A0A6J8AP63_MYTCO|nr:unnamed protein product [Mytilus coruscus]